MKTYKKFIQDILSKKGRFRKTKIKGVYERHHIKPKCTGGSDATKNLIDLTLQEHFIAHKLLAKENPNNNKLVYAFMRMCYDTRSNHKIATAADFKFIRKLYHISVSKRVKEYYINHPEARIELGKKAKKWMTGKKASKDTRKKLSKIQKERYKHKSERIKTKEAMNRPEVKEKLSKASSQYWSKKVNRKKQSERSKGNKNKRNKKLTKKQRENISRAVKGINKGLKNYTNGIINKKARKCPKGFKRGITQRCLPHHWYNNGKKEVWAVKCPKGFKKGLIKARNKGIPHTESWRRKVKKTKKLKKKEFSTQ